MIRRVLPVVLLTIALAVPTHAHAHWGFSYSSWGFSSSDFSGSYFSGSYFTNLFNHYSSFLYRYSSWSPSYSYSGSSLYDFEQEEERGVSVPEPGMLLMLGTGLFGLALVARRRWSAESS